MSVLNLTTKQIKAFLLFASKDEARAHMNGLHVCQQGSAIVATDGHTMSVARREARPGGGDYTVRAADLLAACRLAGPSGSVDIWCDGDDVSLQARGKPSTHPTGAAIGAPMASKSVANFPPWQQVIPEGSAGVKSCHGVNPTFLARMADMQDAFFKGDGVKLSVASGEIDPIRYDWHGSGWSGEIVIMPMRI